MRIRGVQEEGFGVSTTAVIVIAAVALAAVIGLLVFRRRSVAAPAQSTELVRAVDEMRTKMDEMAHDLSEALDRAERETRRNRLFGELGGSIDLEEVMDRVLDAAMDLTGIDAAMMVVESQGGAPAVATRGMTAQEAAKPPTSGVAGALSGTITVSYRYGRDQDLPDEALIRGGVFIPLVGRELRRSEPSRSSGGTATANRTRARSNRRRASPRARCRR